MRLVSINVGKPTAMRIGQRDTTTGIYKVPVAAAQVGPLGLAGDHVDDQKHHGGPDQAVYVYSAEDYDWWVEQLGQPIEPGSFGENLTLSGFGAEPVRIGDRYRVGAVMLEVAAPRIPCATLATRMDDPQFVKKFRQAERPGFYARVLQPGQVRRGDAVERQPADPRHPTLAEVFGLWYESNADAARLRWVLTAPLAVRARAEYAERLRALEVL